MSTNVPAEATDTRIERLRLALRDYHHALDTHQHGGVAAGKLADEVERILETPWKRGATLETLAP